MSQTPADSIARAVRATFARSTYRWTDVRPPLNLLARVWNAIVEWARGVDTTTNGLFAWFLAVVLVILLVHLGWLAWRATHPSLATTPIPKPVSGAADAAAYLREAAALAAAGRYADALAYRFIAVLLQLERAKALKFDPSKTPAEYVRDAKLGAQGRASLASLVSVLYHHIFGAEPCDASEYAAFGAQADEVLRYAAAG